jgi:hypothetical protein
MPGPLTGQRRAVGPLVVALALLLCGRAIAQPNSLGAALFGPRPAAAPVVAKYQADPGETFVFERAPAGVAFLKFEDSSEIWALRPTPGPRGDVIYKNDVGEPVLRATRLGGLTLFTPDRPGGMAAAFAGPAAPPRPATSIGPEALYNMLVQASLRASRAAQHLVKFEAPDVRALADWVFADAASVTAEAFTRVAGRGKSGRAAVARFARVQLSSGRGPSAVAVGEVVQITVAPEQGVAGRPSSERIASVISRR